MKPDPFRPNLPNYLWPSITHPMVLIEFPSHIASRPSPDKPYLATPHSSRLPPFPIATRPPPLPARPPYVRTVSPPCVHAVAPAPPGPSATGCMPWRACTVPVSRPHRALPSGSCGLKSEGKGWRGRVLSVGSSTWGAQFYSPDPHRLSCPYVSFLKRPRIQVNALAFLPLFPSLSLIPLIWLPSSLSSLRWVSEWHGRGAILCAGFSSYLCMRSE
jgi:hypothetical protein